MISSKLKDIITLNYGKSLPSSERAIDGDIPVVGSNGVIGNHDNSLKSGPGIIIGRKGSAGEVSWIDQDYWPIDTTYYVSLNSNYNLKYVVKGDKKIAEISAASIIAKVARDRIITKMSKKFTKYAWDKNAGYGTKDHLFAIKKFGITKHHRKKFQPIHNILSPK